MKSGLAVNVDLLIASVGVLQLWAGEMWSEERLGLSSLPPAC